MATVSDLVKRARNAARLTQVELADAAGINQYTFNRKEKGQYPFDTDELAALARVLRVPLVSLIIDEPPPGALRELSATEQAVALLFDAMRDQVMAEVARQVPLLTAQAYEAQRAERRRQRYVALHRLPLEPSGPAPSGPPLPSAALMSRSAAEPAADYPQKPRKRAPRSGKA